MNAGALKNVFDTFTQVLRNKMNDCNNLEAVKISLFTVCPQLAHNCAKHIIKPSVLQLHLLCNSAYCLIFTICNLIILDNAAQNKEYFVLTIA